MEKFEAIEDYCLRVGVTQPWAIEAGSAIKALRIELAGIKAAAGGNAPGRWRTKYDELARELAMIRNMLATQPSRGSPLDDAQVVYCWARRRIDTSAAEANKEITAGLAVGGET